MLTLLMVLSNATAQSGHLPTSDTSITLGVGMAPERSRLLHEHIGVQHRVNQNVGLYGVLETYSGASIRPGLQGRAFLPLNHNLRLVGGLGVSVWLDTQGPLTYAALMPELDVGIQGEVGPVALAVDLAPALAIGEEVEFWPMARISIGTAF